MGTPYFGEIRIFSFSFAPKNWAFCDGQTMSIQQNQALFSLLGTNYGGNGQTTFCLPNLQGRIPVGIGQNYYPGQSSGEASHTLSTSEMPTHTHAGQASSAPASTKDPSNALWAASPSKAYSSSLNIAMSPQAVGTAGSSQPHENMPPILALNFCIALSGIFPTPG
jgi:microcystin-dependent protein